MTNYDALITRLTNLYADGDPITDEAASAIRELSGISEQLTKQRDELFAALQDIAAYYPNSWAADRANQAIKSVEGEKK
jgi:hypothetical protein